MTELNSTDSTDSTITEGDEFAAFDALAAPAPFVAGYPEAETRVYRKRLHRTEGGVSTATFRGQVADATTAWVKRGRRGISLYVEVTPDDSTATEIRVAVVPTGKRAPLGGQRLGSVGGQHVYLIAVDGSVDRAAFDAESAERAAERAAAQAARMAAYDDMDFEG